MKQLITILLCLFTLFAEAQVNTNDTNKYFKSYDYGFSYKRLQAREAFIMPTDTVINKLGAVSLNGNIYLGNGIKWTSIGGGTSTDTTSLSNRINQHIDSLRSRNDSVFARKNGVFVFQYKDSVGTIPTLQQVTDAAATTTNIISVPSFNLLQGTNSINLTNSNGSFTITNTGTSDEIFNVNNGIYGNLKFGGGLGQSVEILTNNGANVSLQAPQTSGIIPISVNGNTANYSGNITIPTIDTTNKFVNRITRIPGKDSIIYFVGANRFAIKDSVGNSDILKLNISDTSAMLSHYSRTNNVNASLSTKLNISDTASMLSPYAKNNLVATKLNATDTTSLSNRINTKQTDLDLLQLMSYGIKAEPYGVTLANVTSQLALTSPRLCFYPFNWNVSDSIRGISFLNRSATTLTATNYNGVAIYSLSGSTLIRLIFTPNSATFWDNATINTWKTNAITPYFLQKGIYFLGYQVSGSSGTPTIASGTIMQTGLIEPPSAVNTNGIKISSFISNATTTPPSSVAMSTTTILQQIPYFILY